MFFMFKYFLYIYFVSLFILPPSYGIPPREEEEREGNVIANKWKELENKALSEENKEKRRKCLEKVSTELGPLENAIKGFKKQLNPEPRFRRFTRHLKNGFASLQNKEMEEGFLISDVLSTNIKDSNPSDFAATLAGRFLEVSLSLMDLKEKLKTKEDEETHKQLIQSFSGITSYYQGNMREIYGRIEILPDSPKECHSSSVLTTMEEVNESGSGEESGLGEENSSLVKRLIEQYEALGNREMEVSSITSSRRLSFSSSSSSSSVGSGPEETDQSSSSSSSALIRKRAVSGPPEPIKESGCPDKESPRLTRFQKAGAQATLEERKILIRRGTFDPEKIEDLTATFEEDYETLKVVEMLKKSLKPAGPAFSPKESMLLDMFKELSSSEP